jgi:hypothetical protein
VFDATGKKLGNEFLVNTTTADEQRFPSISALPGGGFIVSWSDGSGLGGDDNGFSTKAQVFTLAAPTDEILTGGMVDENSVAGTSVGKITTVDIDPNAIFTYTLTSDAGGRFAINGSTGEITVANGALLDFETATSHGIAIKVTDANGFSFEKSFTIAVNDVNEAPTGATLTGGSADENSASGQTVGIVKGVDPDTGSTFTYALTDDAGGRFAINGSTGEITVANGTLLDFETASSHGIKVLVTDQGGLTIEQSFTIAVNDVNEAPTGATLAGGSVDENSANSKSVGIVKGVDPDANNTFTYALADDAGGRFAIDSNTGEITVANGTLLDFETAISHDIKVLVTDQGGLSVEQSFTIAVNDVNEAPTDELLTGGTVPDHAANGTVVGTVKGVDPDAISVLTYALIDDAGGRFAIDANTGVITVKNGALLDLKTAPSEAISVRVTDQGGLSFDKSFNIALTPVNASTVGTESVLNTTNIGGQFLPGITTLAHGGFVATWTDTSRTAGDGDDSVRAQIFDAQGHKVNAEFIVNTTRAGAQNHSKITALTTGGFVVTWEDSGHTLGDTDGLAVKAKVFNDQGAVVSDEFLVNTTTTGDQDNRAITALTGGRFVITWDDTSGANNGDPSQVKGQMFDARGNKINGEFLVNSTVSNAQQFPTVAGLTDGGFVVSWTDNSGQGGDPDISIKAQRYDVNGIRVGTESLVNTTTASLQIASNAAGLKNGGYVIAWKDFSGQGGDPSQDGIKAQVYDAAGVRVGGEFLVNTTTAGTQQQPVITALGNGDFVIAWADLGGSGADTSGSAIRAQVFSETGFKLGGEFLVNTSTLGDQIDPTITASGTDGFIVAWSDKGVGGVHAQTFTVAPPTSGGSIVSHAAVLAPSTNVIGSSTDDTLQGGSGNDVLTGGGGSDTCVFDRGGGQDRIVNGVPGNTGPSGELDFAAGIRSDQLWFQKDGNNLSIAIMGSQDKVTVANWFSAGASQLQEIKTADGSKIDSNLSQLVQAMATYSSNNPSFDASVATQAPNDAGLQNTIATSWHA